MHTQACTPMHTYAHMHIKLPKWWIINYYSVEVSTFIPARLDSGKGSLLGLQKATFRHEWRLNDLFPPSLIRPLIPERGHTLMTLPGHNSFLRIISKTPHTKGEGLSVEMRGINRVTGVSVYYLGALRERLLGRKGTGASAV